MKKKHREILSELCAICNQLGVKLDYTATHESKLRDRQQAHMLAHHVLFGVLVDHPENDQAEDDMNKAIESLNELKALQAKTYPDRNNYLNPLEKEVTNG
jgi:hypothetical protein